MYGGTTYFVSRVGEECSLCLRVSFKMTTELHGGATYTTFVFWERKVT